MKADVWSRSIVGPLLTVMALAWQERLSGTRFVLTDPLPLALLTIGVSGLVGGVGSGVVSAVLTVAYGLHGYARPYVPAQLLHFTEENLRRFLVSCAAAPLVAVVTGLVGRRFWAKGPDR